MSYGVVIEESGAVMELNLTLPRVNKDTKIREMYDTGDFEEGTLLMIATDKVSVKDKVLLSGIPGKGEVLTRISADWFRQTEQICPNHFITDNFDQLSWELQRLLEPYKSILAGRFMLVRRTKPILAECIVRGKLLGSVRGVYKKTGEIYGIKLPKGLKEGERFRAPIFTPSTKAKYGEHDENITFEQTIKLVGLDTARTIRDRSLGVYSYIANTASAKRIEVPDTKFEFGYNEFGKIIQIDETGTPDSSRYIPDYSKQPLRDWLDSIGWDGTPIELPEEIIEKTSRDYIKGCEILTGYKVTL